MYQGATNSGQRGSGLVLVLNNAAATKRHTYRLAPLLLPSPFHTRSPLRSHPCFLSLITLSHTHTHALTPNNQTNQTQQVERLQDPIAPVSEILCRVPAKQLMSLYKVAAFDQGGVDSFLQQVASARGKLKRGGIVDVEVRYLFIYLLCFVGGWRCGERC